MTSTSLKRSKRRKIRTFLLWLTAVVGVAVVVLLLVVRTLLCPAVENKIAATLGCDVSCGGVGWSSDGIVIRNIELRVPDVESDAGLFFTAGRIRLFGDVWAMARGTASVDSVLAEDAVVRASVNTSTGELNLAPLFDGTGRGGVATLPEITLVDGAIAFGEHDEQSVRTLLHVPVDGDFKRDNDTDSHDYRLTLKERTKQHSKNTAQNEVAMRIDGIVNAETGHTSLVLTGADVSRWAASGTTASVHDWWGELGLVGRSPKATLSYTPQNGVRMRFEIEGVGVTVPLPAAAEAARESLRLEDVSGSLRFDNSGVRAELKGDLEGVAVSARVDARGVATDGPVEIEIEAEPFQLETQQSLLRAAPRSVRNVLHALSGPSGVVQGYVRIARTPSKQGNSANHIATNGVFSFRNGEATFDEFPYPLHDISGSVEFDNDELRIVGVSAAGPDGSPVRLRGVLAPLQEKDSTLALHIELDDTPIHGALRDAIEPDWRKAIDALFDGAKRENVISLMGGKADFCVDVVVPPDNNRSIKVEATIEKLGVCAAAFPYPVALHDAQLHLNADAISITCNSMRPLHCDDKTNAWQGNIELFATLDEDLSNGPEVRIGAKRVQINQTLLDAVSRSSREGARAVAAVEHIGLHGFINVEGVRSSKDSSFALEFHECTALPTRSSSDPLVILLEGRVYIKNELATIGPIIGETKNGARVFLEYIVGGNTNDHGTLRIEELQTTFETRNAIARLVPEFSDAIEELFQRKSAGKIDATIEYSCDASEQIWGVQISNGRDIAFDAFNGRFVFPAIDGNATWNSRSPHLIQMSHLKGDAFFHDEQCGRIEFDGTWNFETNSSIEQLSISVLQGEAGSLATCALLDFSGIPGVALWIKEHNLQGQFDAKLLLDSGAGFQAQPKGTIWPRSIGLAKHGVNILFPAMHGKITFDANAVQIHGVQGIAKEWSFSTEGKWDSKEDILSIDFSLQADRLNEEIRSFVPKNTKDFFDDIKLRVDGSLSVKQANILRRTNKEGIKKTSFDGVVLFHDAAMRPGMVFDHADGSVKIHAMQGEPGQAGQLEATFSLDTVTAASIPMSDVRATIQNATNPNGFSIEGLTASSCGGRIAADATIQNVELQGKPHNTYEVDLRLAGVQLGKVLQAVNAVPANTDTSRRGVLHGQCSFAGIAGRPQDRVGRGSILAVEGEILQLPLLTGLLELSNLLPPTNEAFDFALADFLIIGNRIDFQELTVRSNSVVIVGEGGLDLQDFGLDLKFTTSGNIRVPVLSDVFAALRDELATFLVRGTLTEPDFRVEQLGSTRRVFEQMFGEQQRQMPEVAPKAPRTRLKR